VGWYPKLGVKKGCSIRIGAYPYGYKQLSAILINNKAYV
jgi:hypothetical protein